ncbi:MAG: TonB-dependent receptor [Gemmatimonadaceae bacterium]|nr:TonB-dependent receptor [Gemmatimonadaceae bacterium]
MHFPGILAAAALVMAVGSEAAAAQRSGGTTPQHRTDDSAAAARRRLDTVRVSTRVTDRSGFTLEVLDRTALDRLPGSALPQVLARALGVDVQARSPASADVSVRGGSYQQVLVLLDGVRVNDAQTAHFALDLPVPLDEIERIEVLRGGASALYGPDAAGGVINIVRKHGTSRTLHAEGGSFGTARIAAAGGMGAAGSAVRAAAEYSTSDGSRPGTDYEIRQAQLGGERRIGATQLGLDGGWARRAFGANAFYGPYNSYETTNTGTLALRAARALDDRRELRFAASWRRHDDDFILRRENPAAYRNLHTNASLLEELSVRQLVGGGAVTLGGEAAQMSLASATLGKRSENRIAVFVEDAHGLRSATITTAARLDHSSVTGSAFSPSLTLRLPLATHYGARLAVARGIRAPSWTERYYKDPANEGTPTLGVETFWTGDAAIGREFSRGSAELTAFVRSSHDLIDWIRPVSMRPQNIPWVASNISDATLHGIELAAEYRELIGIDWHLRLQGTRFTTSLPGGFVGKYALRPVTRSAGITAMRSFGAGVTATVDVAHSRRAGEDGYTTADARLEWATGGEWRVTLDGTNLGRARWLDVTGMPAPGTAAMLGLSWTAHAKGAR